MIEKRNILTIAPLLADDFVDLEEPIFDTDKYSSFLKQNSERLGIFKKYLICKLHDSWIIEISEKTDSLKIELNDFSTYVFADSIIERYKLPIDSDNISFPLIIEFKGDLKIEYNKVGENGLLEKIESLNLDEYLYEQVTSLDNERIEIVFNFWKSNLKDDKPGERIIMIVSTNELTLIENQDQAWTKLFGNKFDEYYTYFKEQFNSDRYVSDHNECEILINEIEEINKSRPHNNV